MTTTLSVHKRMTARLLPYRPDAHKYSGMYWGSNTKKTYLQQGGIANEVGGVRCNVEAASRSSITTRGTPKAASVKNVQKLNVNAQISLVTTSARDVLRYYSTNYSALNTVRRPMGLI